MKSHRILLIAATVSTLAFSGNVSAAGLFDQVTEPVWNGFYFGVNVGGGIGDTDIQETSGGKKVFGDSQPDGMLGGGVIGYNYLYNQFVIGLVGDIALANINDVCTSQPKKNDCGKNALLETDYEWIASARARGGWLATPNTLLYVHGGGAFAQINMTELSGSGPFGGGSAEDEEIGWTAGAGVETKMYNDVSLFLEYSYIDLGEPNYTIKGDKAVDHDNKLHLIKFGANFMLF